MWAGSYISAAFLADRHFWVRYPSLLRSWDRTGLLQRGPGEWILVNPKAASYEETFSQAESHSFEWNSIERLVDQATNTLITELTIPFQWVHRQGELRVHAITNQDDSVTVYIDAPSSHVYDGLPDTIGLENIRRFSQVAKALFEPHVFLVGHIGEETQLPSLSWLKEHPTRLPYDWAFYGASLSYALRTAACGLAHQAAEVLDINGTGLFVRWTSWEQGETCPPSWRNALVQAHETLVQTEMDC